MIAISAAYNHDLRNRQSDLYLIYDDSQNMQCLTVHHQLPVYDNLQWLAQQSILFRSYTPAAQYSTIDVTTGVVRPFIPEFNPHLISAVTADGTIVFPTRHHHCIVPLHGSLDDCSTLVINGRLVALSTDGKWLAFYKKETPEFVYVQELNTSHVHRISMVDLANDHDADSRTVAWSPDSQYLAYEANYQELWVMRADGTQRRKVGELEYFWLKFRWSPDSNSIAFIGPAPATTGDGPNIAEAPLYVSNIDNPAPRYLATLHKNDASGGAWDWMPDGQHLVYATHINEQASLYKINIQIGTQHLLTDPNLPFAAIYDVAVSR